MVPPTVERLDMSLDDIIKLQKKAVKKTRPDAAGASGTERQRGTTTRMTPKMQKKQLQSKKKGGVSKAAPGGSRRVKANHVQQRGRMGRQRVAKQAARQLEQKQQRLPPNGVAVKRRTKGIGQQWKNRKNWVLQGNLHSHQQFNNQSVRRGVQMQQPPVVTRRVPRNLRQGRGPSVGTFTKQHALVQSAQGIHWQQQRLLTGQRVNHGWSPQRGVKRRLTQQGGAAIELPNKRVTFRQPSKPVPKVQSSAFQLTNSAPSRPRTLNERFSSYGRNSGIGNWNVSRGGLKVIVRH